ALGLGRDSCCKFSLLSIMPGIELFHLTFAETKFFSYLSPGHSLVPHLKNRFFIFLHMTVFSRHSKDLLWYFYSTTGGLLFSLSTFTGAVQRRRGFCFYSRFAQAKDLGRGMEWCARTVSPVQANQFIE